MAVSISGVSTTNDCNNYVHLKDAYSPRKLMIKASDGFTKSDTLHNSILCITTHSCQSAMNLRFPKPDSRDALQATTMCKSEGTPLGE